MVFAFTANTKTSLTCKEGVMRSKVEFLGYFCALFFGIVPATWTMAADSLSASDSAYTWTGIYDVSNLRSFTVTSQSVNPSYGVGIYSVENPGEILTLFNANDTNAQTSAWTFTVEEVDSAYGTYRINNTRGGSPLYLGTSLNFGFVFYSGSESVLEYLVTSATTTTTNIYTVSHGNTTVNVGGNAIASVSAVPIPGSALLLGSSLLGLVGISSRKKRA
jgi:hypothetical protein